MSCKVDTTDNFEREAKRLINKYKSLKKEIEDLIDELEENPEKGTDILFGCFCRAGCRSGLGRFGLRGGFLFVLFPLLKKYLLQIYYNCKTTNVIRELQTIFKLFLFYDNY